MFKNVGYSFCYRLLLWIWAGIPKTKSFNLCPFVFEMCVSFGSNVSWISNLQQKYFFKKWYIFSDISLVKGKTRTTFIWNFDGSHCIMTKNLIKILTCFPPFTYTPFEMIIHNILPWILCIILNKPTNLTLYIWWFLVDISWIL